VLASHFEDFEIIVVNDGSSDGSQDLLIGLSSQIPELKVIQHPQNLGYGAALNSGFCAATKDFVMFMDSDQQFDIQEIKKFLPHMEPSQIVTGYRENRMDQWYRRLNAWAYNNLVVKGLFGVDVKDVNCAFRIYPGSFIAQTRPYQSTGALINCEMYKLAKKMDIDIVEIPVTHLPRTQGDQTGANLGVILRMFCEAAVFRWELWKAEKRRFMPREALRVGLSGAIVGLLMTLLTFFAISKHAPHSDISDTLAVVDRQVELSGVHEIDALRHLDAQWYLDIARHGYQIDSGQSNVVFFPLYPVLIKSLSVLTGQSLAICAQILSTFFTLLASGLFCVFAWRYFRKIGVNDHWLKTLPMIAVGALLMHPMAIFLHAAYPESLFLTLCLSIFLCHQNGKIGWMIFFTFLIALTRPQGLFIPCAFVGFDVLSSFKARRLRFSPETLGMVLAGGAGIALFAGFLYFFTGDAWSFWSKRAAWDAQASLWNIPKLLAPVIGKQHFVPKVLLYATLAGSVMLWRHGLKQVAIVCAAFVILPLYKGDLGDLSRYSLLAIFAVLPFLIWVQKAPVVFISGFAASACLNGLFLARFLDHIWVG
jgi:glycosyltransferase involved in cell wall biosynthesis